MTINELTQEYTQWLLKHDYPSFSADELLVQTTGEEDGDDDVYVVDNAEHRQWLRNFIERWETAEEESRPQFVQNITEDFGVGIVVIDEAFEDAGLGFHMEYGNNELCELHDGECNEDGILWQADDMGSPYICTTHFFPQEQLGYEFIAV